MTENINFNDYIENNCFLASQYNFMNQVDFDNDNTFEMKMKDCLKAIFKDIKFKSIIFDVPYLINNEVRKNNLKKYIEREENKIYNLTSFSFGINSEYYIISKVSEVNFFQKNEIDFSEFLLDKFEQIKISLINDRIKEKMIDEKEKKELEETLEQLEREREVIKIPMIKKVENIILENDIIKIIIKGIKKEILFNKNSLHKNFEENYKKCEIGYAIFLTKLGEKDYITQTNFNIDNSGNIIFTLNNLEENTLYVFRISITFERFFSEPNYSFYFFYPEKNPKKNLIFYSNETISIFPIENEETETNKVPILFKEKVFDSSYYTNTSLTIINKGEVIISGNVKVKEIEEGQFCTFNIEDVDNEKIKNQILKKNILDLPKKTHIKKISLGDEFGLLLDIYGKIYSFGNNENGQLGLNLNNSSLVGNPKEIKLNEEIFFYDIACCDNASLALGFKNNNKVLFFWGNCFNEKINHFQNTPHKINFVNCENIIKIFGKNSSFGILCYDYNKNINKFYVMGNNKFYNFGVDNKKEIFDEFDLINFFYDNCFSVENVSFEENYTVVMGVNQNKEKEIYYSGTPNFLTNVKNWVKIEKNWIKDVLCFYTCSQSINFFLSNGFLKVYNSEKEEKEENIKLIENESLLNNVDKNNIKIEGDEYNLILLF